MGQLKEMLEKSIRESSLVDENTTEASNLFRSYQSKFKQKVGKPLIWNTTSNPNLKQPQLVIVECSYRYFALVSKKVYNVDSVESILYYAVNYSSLFSGQDHVEFLGE